MAACNDLDCLGPFDDAQLPVSSPTYDAPTSRHSRSLVHTHTSPSSLSATTRLPTSKSSTCLACRLRPPVVAPPIRVVAQRAQCIPSSDLSSTLKVGLAAGSDAGRRDKYVSSTPAAYAAEPTCQTTMPPLAVSAARNSRSGMPVRTSRAPTTARAVCTRCHQRCWRQVTDLMWAEVHDRVEIAPDVRAVRRSDEAPAHGAVTRLAAPVVLLRAVRRAPHLDLAREDVPERSRCTTTPIFTVPHVRNVLVVERKLPHCRGRRKVIREITRPPPLLATALGAPQHKPLLGAVLRRGCTRRQRARARARNRRGHGRLGRVLRVWWRGTVVHE